MTVYVRWVQKKGRKQRWLEYHIKNRHPNDEPIEERRKSHLRTEAATRKWAEQREAELLSAGPQGRNKPAPKFKEFSERWLQEHDAAQRHKASTIETKKWILGSHLARFDDRRLDQITLADVDKLKSDMALAKKSPKTTNNVLSVLSKLLKTAEKWGEIRKAPVIELVRSERRIMPFFSTEHYEALIAGARKVGIHALSIVLLAGDAGLRRGELLGLEWGDVDFQRRVIRLERSQVLGKISSLKGRDWRVVPMSSSLAEALLELRGKKKTGRVFNSLRWASQRMDRKTMNELVGEAEKAAGLPVTGKLHALRHTYASLLASAGVSMWHLKNAMGHTDMATTEGYAKLSGDALRPLADAIDARRKKPGDIQETTPALPPRS